VAFLNLLYSSKILPRETNKILWSPTCNHRFKVKNYYHTLQYGESFLFSWKSVWKVKAPRCITFFTWMVALSKIFTFDKLRRRGPTHVSWCCLCKRTMLNQYEMGMFLSKVRCSITPGARRP
jgi:hypothetical protein